MSEGKPCADYYSLDEHAEQLWCEDPVEAASQFDISEYDYPVKVYAFRRRVLTDKEIQRLADLTIQFLSEQIEDEEWSNPEEPHLLEQAFRESLASTIREHMPKEHVWHCERAPECDVMLDRQDVEGATTDG